MAGPTEPTNDYKTPFLSSCLTNNALTFGTYTLKSGRISPYFFNAGLLHTGSLLISAARAFASILSSPPFALESKVEYDVLFGPAYKGIPFCAATLTALAGMGAPFDSVSFGFNRKEAKDHGEGGMTVGADLKGKRVVIIDDVITAGTALREAVGIIQAAGGKVVGVVLLLDREERTRGENGAEGDEEGAMSAVGSARETLGVPVEAIVGLKDLIEVLGGSGIVSQEHVEAMKGYRERYGAKEG
jgi:orotate phosphoribosyltransferase